MIELNNIKAYISERLLFSIKNFVFYDGKKYILIGENGAGKSTLIKSFIGLNKFVQGEIKNNRKIIYQSQKPFLFKNSVRDNFKIIGINVDNIIDDFKFLEINELVDQSIESLSGGEREKVIFLRSIIRAEETLILDEPFSQMDKKSKIKANVLLDNWLKEKSDRMIILITHDSLKDYTFDYIVELKKGRLIRIN